MIKGKKEGGDRKKERKVSKTKLQETKGKNEKDRKEGCGWWMDERRKERQENKEKRLKCHANIIGTLPSCLADDTVRPSFSLSSCFLFSDTFSGPSSHPQRSPAFNVLSPIRTWAKHTHCYLCEDFT